jgi:hypothetical protein
MDISSLEKLRNITKPVNPRPRELNGLSCDRFVDEKYPLEFVVALPLVFLKVELLFASKPTGTGTKGFELISEYLVEMMVSVEVSHSSLE